MARRFLTVDGCDDSTVVEITDLPDDHIAVVQMIAERVTDASTGQCHPTAEVVDESHFMAQYYLRESDK